MKKETQTSRPGVLHNSALGRPTADGTLEVTVQRTGSTSGSAHFDYSTSDNSATSARCHSQREPSEQK